MVSGRNIHHLTNAAYVADAKISWRLALLVKKLELEERICLGICLGVGLIGYEHSKDVAHQYAESVESGRKILFERKVNFEPRTLVAERHKT